MKLSTLILIGLLSIIAWPKLRELTNLTIPSDKLAASEASAATTTPPPAPKKEEATDAARKFEVIVQQIVPGGGIGVAAFYDWPPSVETHPEGLGYPKSRRKQAGRIFVAGLPGGLVDGNQWKGWLEPDGTTTYTAVSGAYTTVSAYHVVPAPKDPLHKQGDWMLRGGYDNPLSPPSRRY